MNTSFRRALLAGTAVLGLYVGVWAEFLPSSFAVAFPGFGHSWIEGPFNEHLIRDVGGLYLALTAISIAALVARTAAPGRLAGLGWGVFGVLHFGYHVTHPTGSTFDVAASLASLAIAALLGIALALPSRDRSGTKEARA